MQSAAARMRLLLDSLLRYSRVTTRQNRFIPVDLTRVVLSVIENHKFEIQASNAKVELGDMPMVTADEEQMHELVQNLIENALRYTLKAETPLIRIYGRTFEGSAQILGLFTPYLNHIGKGLDLSKGKR